MLVVSFLVFFFGSSYLFSWIYECSAFSTAWALFVCMCQRRLPVWHVFCTGKSGSLPGLYKHHNENTHRVLLRFHQVCSIVSNAHLVSLTLARLPMTMCHWCRSDDVFGSFAICTSKTFDNTCNATQSFRPYTISIFFLTFTCADNH